jgi:D-arabinose 5-phosphate isomerase GutQ
MTFVCEFDGDQDDKMESTQPLETIIQELTSMLEHIDIQSSDQGSEATDELLPNIAQRINSISLSVIETASQSLPSVMQAVRLFRDWMVEASVVRVIGAGRARLAGSIPANRLAHGGARVYIIDDIMPMPHSIMGGGIIAVSASGKTESVLNVLKSLRTKQARVRIVGIANHGAEEFSSMCDVFIGIREVNVHNPLRALADTEEFVISMLLDAIVVAAGKLAGFDDTKWRLGHEDIGPTGPYNPQTSDVSLAVSVIDSGKSARKR